MAASEAGKPARKGPKGLKKKKIKKQSQEVTKQDVDENDGPKEEVLKEEEEEVEKNADDNGSSKDENEEEEEEEEGPKKISKKTQARRLEEAGEAGEAAASKEPRGVIYLGHIPKGLAEPQMKEFFGQFGELTRLRISRSKKNAAPKGYGFIEFAEESVAKIVADTMNKYLLFGKSLVCHIVPKEKQHPALWKGCNKKMINREKIRRDSARKSFNDRPTVEIDGETVPQVTTTQLNKQKNKLKKLKGKLERLGVDFDPHEVVPVVPDIKLLPGLTLKSDGIARCKTSEQPGVANEATNNGEALEKLGVGSKTSGGNEEAPPIAEVQQRKKKRRRTPVGDDASGVTERQSDIGGVSAGVLDAGNDDKKVSVTSNEEANSKNPSGKKRKKVRSS